MLCHDASVLCRYTWSRPVHTEPQILEVLALFMTLVDDQVCGKAGASGLRPSRDDDGSTAVARPDDSNLYFNYMPSSAQGKSLGGMLMDAMSHPSVRSAWGDRSSVSLPRTVHAGFTSSSPARSLPAGPKSSPEPNWKKLRMHGRTCLQLDLLR